MLFHYNHSFHTSSIIICVFIWLIFFKIYFFCLCSKTKFIKLTNICLKIIWRVRHIIIKILLFVYLSHPHLATHLSTYLPNPILYLPLNLPFHYLHTLNLCYLKKSKYYKMPHVTWKLGCKMWQNYISNCNG